MRYKAEGRYQLARVDATLLRPSSQLALRLSGCPRLVPPSILSNANPLADGAAWQQEGRQELEALRSALAGQLPTCGEVSGRAGLCWLMMCDLPPSRADEDKKPVNMHCASSLAGGGCLLPAGHGAAVGAAAGFCGSGSAA